MAFYLAQNIVKERKLKIHLCPFVPNGGEYYVQATGGSCSPSSTSSKEIELNLFEDGDIIKENNGYERGDDLCLVHAFSLFMFVLSQ